MVVRDPGPNFVLVDILGTAEVRHGRGRGVQLRIKHDVAVVAACDAWEWGQRQRAADELPAPRIVGKCGGYSPFVVDELHVDDARARDSVDILGRSRAVTVINCPGPCL